MISDLHINSTVAICPPTVNLDDGGTYSSSRTQRWLWKVWLDFWARVQDETGGYRKVLCLNGDLGELDTKRRTTQLITANKATILNIVRDVLEPAVYDTLYVVRGTRAHEGKSAWLEEEIAKDLSAVPMSDDIHSWWQIRAVVEGVKFDIAHHATMGKLPWSKGNSVLRLANETIWNYRVDRHTDPPDVVVRSHNHTYAEAAANGTRVYYTPAWTMIGDFGYRISYENALPSIGGIVFLCDGGECTVKKHLYFAQKERRIWSMTL